MMDLAPNRAPELACNGPGELVAEAAGPFAVDGVAVPAGADPCAVEPTGDFVPGNIGEV